MITRIHKLINKEGMSVRKFEQSINASNGLIRKAIANNTDVQSKWIVEIAKIYPHLSLDWLITGTGDMYRCNGDDKEMQTETNMYQLNELRVNTEVLRSINDSNKALIESQAETIKSKNEIIEMKNRIIAQLSQE